MDKSVDRQGIDTFALGDKFESQSGSKTTSWDVPDRKDAKGDTVEIVTRNEKYEFSQDYNYNGVDLATDLTAKLKLGETVIGVGTAKILIDEVSITFGEQAAVKIAIKGHNHDQNPHEGVCMSAGTTTGVALDLASIIGAAVKAWDVPVDKPFANADTDSSPTSLSVNLKIGHDDVKGADGNHLVGASFDPMVEVSLDYVGAPTLTTTGWTVTSDETSNGNQAFDTSKISAKRQLSR